MHTWDLILGSASELDLLRIGEALQLGPPPRTAMAILQRLLTEAPRPSLAEVLAHLSPDSLTRACARARLGEPSDPAEARRILLEAAATGEGADWLTVEVPRRKPRLAWHGMHIPSAVTSVPTQVLEVVSPRLARHRGDTRQAQLDGLDVARSRAAARAPVNRLIWTSDNLVALRTLLDERDPVTHDWRYRGKVDLVYIDPPFMVNNDFVADNSITIDVDGDEGVSAVKEPSLVEILAYKDTWREGLDSFLSMLRARLLLLKELLAPTGSIYVHLDWHAAHYVKVLMDELFGYDLFATEVVWQRTTQRLDQFRFNPIHDVMLGFRVSPGAYFVPQFAPYDPGYVASHYRRIDEGGRRFRADNLTANRPGGDTSYEWRGKAPYRGRYWAYSREKMEQFEKDGRLVYTKTGMPEYKRYLDEMPGAPVSSVWVDVPPVNAQDAARLGYPTQKPVPLVERIISASCPPGGLVLDCFLGSGTTAEAAERLGRRWIGIDNGKYAVHLARKRLIMLHDQPRPPEKVQYDYVECESCKNIARKKRRQRSPGRFEVRPFSLESMGVYQRAEVWLDANGEPGAWRGVMVEVFGGEPVQGFSLLHGKDHRGWIHVGPLDAPVPARQAWSIAREAADTDTLAVTILSADLDTLPQPEREAIREQTGVQVVLRIIPRTAIEQVALRLKRSNGADGAVESMAVPAFYTPLAIGIRAQVDGPRVKLTLERCEVDVQSFLKSQRPALEPVTEGMSAAQRKRATKALERWEKRREKLEGWLAKATTWQQFVDFWAVDWDYTDHIGPDGKPVFDTDWQSFRIRRGRKKVDPLVLTAECEYERPGRYQIAARVTDVFGNDGIAVVDVTVGR